MRLELSKIQNRNLARWLVFHLFLLCTLRPVIAPVPVETIIDAAHEGATGIADTHDATAAKTAIEVSKGSPVDTTSHICRRRIGGCLFNWIKRPARTAEVSPAPRTSQSLEEGRVTQQLERPRKWATSFSTKLRRVEQRILFALNPQIRDDWHLGQANYEEVIWDYFRHETPWEDFNALLSQIIENRRRSTLELGGFSSQVSRYIRNERLPKLYEQLYQELHGILSSAISGRQVQLRIENGLNLLENLFDAEIRDTGLEPMIKALQPLLKKAIELYPRSRDVRIPLNLRVVGVPESPSLFTRVKPPPKPPRTQEEIWQWINFQDKAEDYHMSTIRGPDTLMSQKWGAVQREKAIFKTSAEGTNAWNPNEGFTPRRFSVANYKLFEQVEATRRDVVEQAATFAQPLSSAIRPTDALRERRLLALEALMIESYVGSNSREAKYALQALVSDNSETAKDFLSQAKLAQSGRLRPPRDVTEISFVRVTVRARARAYRDAAQRAGRGRPPVHSPSPPPPITPAPAYVPVAPGTPPIEDDEPYWQYYEVSMEAYPWQKFHKYNAQAVEYLAGHIQRPR